jgi:hypothetical protein
MRITEPTREIPITGDADVIVCGAGPAGIGAALAAARAGAKVRLLEVNGCVGGVWTAGILAWLFEMQQPGITREITAELDRRGARNNLCSHDTKQYAYDVEAMKLLLEEWLTDAGVEFHLHTRVVAAIKDGRRIKAIVTESKSGREAWTAKTFIDCSGDGDLAALCGCGFDLGKPGSGALQPFTYMALITASDLEGLKPFLVFLDGYRHPSFIGPTQNFLKEIQSAGVDPSYHASTLFHLRDNLLALMINHEYGVSPINERDVTKATVRGRAEVNRVVTALRKRGGPWKDVLLVATPEQVGTREGRRIHGRYTVSTDDLRIGAVHEDAVCNVTYQIDVHSTDPTKGKGFEQETFKAKPYDIPLRALIAKDIDNLLMAGRCISGDFIAHSSYRVTGISVALGQAAGVAGALASRANLGAADIAYKQVRETLTGIFRV